MVQLLVSTGLMAGPATFIIDREGIIRFEYRGKGSFDRPPVDKILKAIDGLWQTKK